jgi:hypothetical protein
MVVLDVLIFRDRELVDPYELLSPVGKLLLLMEDAPTRQMRRRADPK